LEVILWCIRGEPRGLQDDVQGWLEEVLLGFLISNQEYEISFAVKDKTPAGKLTCYKGNHAEVIDTFTSTDGFSAAMSRFWMDTLDLEPIPARQVVGDDGQSVLHGWTALSGAMFLGGEHNLLLGDVVFGGLPGRMLQMFVGMPWALSVMQAATAEKELAGEAQAASRTATATRSQQEQAVLRITNELEDAKQQLRAAPEYIETGKQIVTLGKKVSQLSRRVAELDSQLQRSTEQAARLQVGADQDEQDLRSLREDIIAERFFNGLSPSCCPRCEISISAERRKRESTSLLCAVCSEPVSNDRMEAASLQIESAQSRSEASRVAARRAAELEEELAGRRAVLASELAAAQEELDGIVRFSGQNDRRRLELEVARLEGALAERRITVEVPAPSIDAVIVKTASEEAKKRFEEVRGDLFGTLNREILALGQRFGIRELEEIDLDTRAIMRLRKGGQSTSFSKLTAGERLRLRIATVIALLRIGQQRGIGRHPGLLLIDSPGAEETSDHDLASLLAELCAIGRELPDLQILVATANVNALEAALAPDHCRIAPPNGFLW
jgi:hypothetical protein